KQRIKLTISTLDERVEKPKYLSKQDQPPTPILDEQRIKESKYLPTRAELATLIRPQH
ncbi:10967_t:CDS:1, partial [Dentiscutata erythropus]